MFRTTEKVGYSGSDSNDLLTLDAAVTYMQDCTIFHLESIGRGARYFGNKGQAVFVVSWQLDIDKMPTIGTDINIDTWVYGSEIMYSYRNFIVSDNLGNIYIKAHAIGAFVETETGRPTKITPEVMANFPIKPKLDMDYQPRKISMAKDWDFIGEETTVRKRHLDKNNHVNNTKYITLAEEYLPDGFNVRRLRVEYKKPAVYGNKIIPKVKASDNGLLVGLCSDDGSTFAVTEFFS